MRKRQKIQEVLCGLKMIRIALLYFLLIQSALASHTMTLSSSSLDPNTAIPVLYTCDGKNISPALTWSGTPAGSKSFTLVIADPDAPGGTFYHWIVFNLPITTTVLEDNSLLPNGAMLGKNSWGNMQYKGPCPPRGTTHHYIFTIYALDTLLNIPFGSKFETLNAAMAGHILDQASFRTTYTH